ncbi:MAG: hypothetical protein AUG49_05650 [Catenulispora sp. 13_1_20CM_3_70_7]|nr:MAG: hypothetical protein AUG49_05650 [Catenulispora sp. 13_1_20CM_3_70_7]
MSSDARVVAIALGVAAVATLMGVWFAAWIAQFHLGRPPVRRRTAVPLPPSVTASVNRRQLLALAQELAAHAHATAVQAVRAHTGHQAAAAALAEAEVLRARAEAEYDAARLAYAAALGTARAHRPHEPDAQAQAREREVSRAALDAYRRGELSVQTLRSVFGRAELDPEQDERERAADRLAVREAQARHAFEHAVVVARMAREDLHIAEVADAATQQEAAAAAYEAREAQLALNTIPVRRGGTGRKRTSGTAHPTRPRAVR